MSAFAKRSAASRAVSVGSKTLALGAGVLLLASCAGGPTAETSEPAAAGDGTLFVGSILPETGTLAFLGPPEFAGVDLAVQDIQATDFPFEVTVQHEDSGDSSNTEIASQSADLLIDAGADVVIGAASSSVSLAFIDKLVEAGIVQISPANTSPEFTDYPDEGYYWRTAPSDVLQGQVLGNLMMQEAPGSNIGMIVLNDSYGLGLAENAQAAIEAAGGTVVANEQFNTGESNFAGIVSTVLEAEPDAIAMITFEEWKSLLPELVDVQGFPADQVYWVDGNLSNDADQLDFPITGSKGTLPGTPASEELQARLLEIDPELTDFSYAPESYDAVIVAALAAAQGGSDDSDVIKENLQSVSAGGTVCTEFAECLDLINAGEDIDYDGASGPIEFSDAGDPQKAVIGIYEYGDDNHYSLFDTIEGDLTAG